MSKPASPELVCNYNHNSNQALTGRRRRRRRRGFQERPCHRAVFLYGRRWSVLGSSRPLPAAELYISKYCANITIVTIVTTTHRQNAYKCVKKVAFKMYLLTFNHCSLMKQEWFINSFCFKFVLFESYLILTLIGF